MYSSGGRVVWIKLNEIKGRIWKAKKNKCVYMKGENLVRDRQEEKKNEKAVYNRFIEWEEGNSRERERGILNS